MAAAARRRKADAPKINVAEATKIKPETPRPCPSLVPDLLANIHDRLGFLDRLAFAAVFAASCHDDLFKRQAPWLLLPCTNKPQTIQLFSIADRTGTALPAPEPALRDHLVIGSAHGWLATADIRGQMYLVNPATGEQHKLPHTSTMAGVFHPSTHSDRFTIDINSFLTIRYGHGPPFNHPWRYDTLTLSSEIMRRTMYCKVVLSSSPRPSTYAAMLISELGAPAFASAEDPTWRLALSPGGVEDAIHQDGQFYSVSYTGLVEAWRRDANSGGHTSTVVAPKLPVEDHKEPDRERSCPRKYLAAAPGGQLMVVIKYPEQSENRFSCSFKVHVLCGDGQWKETADVGDLALFVGLNNSLCVPTMGRPHVKAGCVYYTDDVLKDVTPSSYLFHLPGLRAVGVYNLMDGTLEKIEAPGEERQSYDPLPVWITPSIP